MKMKLPPYVGSEVATEPTYAVPEPTAAMGSGTARGFRQRRFGCLRILWVLANPPKYNAATDTHTPANARARAHSQAREAVLGMRRRRMRRQRGDGSL